MMRRSFNIIANSNVGSNSVACVVGTRRRIIHPLVARPPRGGSRPDGELLFLPDVLGEKTPLMNPHASGQFAPDPGGAEVLDRKYQFWRESYRRRQTMFPRLRGT
jgi:hypothetical protein